MEFPITREGLQNFDCEAAQETAQEKRQKEQRYAFYKALIANICGDVEIKIMNAQQNSLILRDKQYVWKDIGILGNWGRFLTQSHKYGEVIEIYRRNMSTYRINAEQLNQSIPEFIELLKKTFIGCDIIVDPLKTYLIIDWS